MHVQILRPASIDEVHKSQTFAAMLVVVVKDGLGSLRIGHFKIRPGFQTLLGVCLHPEITKVATNTMAMSSNIIRQRKRMCLHYITVLLMDVSFL
jgi:hypothetical protein